MTVIIVSHDPALADRADPLVLPESATVLVVFAHGSGSSRHSPRNRQVARALNDRRLATLLLDLLTADEERDRANVFDVGLLAGRLVAATRWAQRQPRVTELRVGYFGASTGAAAALSAASELEDEIGAVVSRGGRPDLAAARLPAVRAPVLLITCQTQNIAPITPRASGWISGFPHCGSVVIADTRRGLRGPP